MQYGPIHYYANGLDVGDTCPLCQGIIHASPMDAYCGCVGGLDVLLATNWRGEPIQDEKGIWRFPLKEPRQTNKTKEQLFDMILEQIFEYEPRKYTRYLDETFIQAYYEDWFPVVREINKFLKDKENGWG